MLNKLKENNGGAMLAALILIPVLAAGSLAAYQMANKSATVTMKAAMEEDAIFSSESVADILIGQITSDPAKRDQIVKAAADAMLFSTSTITPGTLTRKDPNPRYEKIATLYTVKKLPQSAIAKEAEANTIAIEITTRTYNKANPFWSTTPYVEHVTQQEFNMGLVKVGGCAANYDIYAAHDYSTSAMMGLMSSRKIAYYTGHEWSSSVFMGFSSNSTSCADAPNVVSGDKEIKETTMMFFTAYCTNTSFGTNANCNATNTTFGGTLYGDSDMNEDGTLDKNQFTQMNINDSTHYSSTYPYPWTSLEKTVIDHISKNARSATTHAAALAAMGSDPDVYKSGSWYFRDTDHNHLPDSDTPYLYYEGNYNSIFPFDVSMMRFRNTYIYVNGSITKFTMTAGTGMNSGQLYLIASGDINSISMMNMSMKDTGTVLLAKGKIGTTAMMEMSGMSSDTLMANSNITITSGFNIDVNHRVHFLSGNDITTASMFTFSSTVGTGHCGCTAGSEDITTEMQIGRRLSKS